MKRVSNKKEIVIFLIFMFCVLLSILSIVWNPFSLSKSINNYPTSVNEAFKKERLTENEKVISEVEFDDVAFVLIDSNHSLRIVNYKKIEKNNQIIYEKKADSVTEKFFSGSKKQTIDREMFEKILNHSRNQPELFSEKHSVRMYSTMNEQELELKLNNEKAAKVIKYQSKGKMYYFLFFADIDYSNEMVFNY